MEDAERLWRGGGLLLNVQEKIRLGRPSSFTAVTLAKAWLRRAELFEYDEQGREWFGYTFSSEENDHAAVIATFMGNVQYAEWYYRQIASKTKQRTTLAGQLTYLFELLPAEVEGAITDDRAALIRDIIHTRNRYAHGKFEDDAPATARVHTVSVKVAALMAFSERAKEEGAEAAVSMARGGSPYMRGKLRQTDVPP